MTESTASAPQAAMTVHLPKGRKALAIGAESGIGKATAIGPCRVGTDVVGTRYRGLGRRLTPPHLHRARAGPHCEHGLRSGGARRPPLAVLVVITLFVTREDAPHVWRRLTHDAGLVFVITAGRPRSPRSGCPCARGAPGSATRPSKSPPPLSSSGARPSALPRSHLADRARYAGLAGIRHTGGVGDRRVGRRPCRTGWTARASWTHSPAPT